MTVSSEDLLLPDHRTQLEAESGIAPEIIRERGYRSIEVKATLRQLGFAESQLSVPTLVLPVRSVSGEIVSYQHRPDTPRIVKGKPLRYETPSGSRMALDIHPAGRDKVRNPSIPILITEGIKKGDSAVSRDILCLVLLGVWNWRGRNELGGTAALSDWEMIPLNGRVAYIAFDSDVMLKQSVYAALVRLGAFLTSRGAIVRYIYLPSTNDGRKVGLDDFFVAGHTPAELFALATEELRGPPSEDDEAIAGKSPYEESEHGIFLMKSTRDGVVPQRLTNFTARIVEQLVEDDGVEKNLNFLLQTALRGQQTTFTTTAAKFATMGWHTDNLGASAIVFPGHMAKDHARTAIQELSGDPPVTTVYTHVGWRKLDNGERVYLHGAGAVRAASSGVSQLPGQNVVRAYLPPALQPYELPNPPAGKHLVQAVRASMMLLELAPQQVSVPLYASIWRAACGFRTPDFSLFIVGATGTFKTEHAALAQQHFGAGLNSRNLPGAWSSTENALEGLAFLAKDAILVIDDFVASANPNDQQRLHARAERVLRAQGNHSGRMRMQADGTLRPVKPPRGLIVATGEDVPSGQSLRARTLVLEMSRGDIDAGKLNASQLLAAEGAYAQAMAGFLSWLAPQYEEQQGEWTVRVGQLRAQALSVASVGMHLRTSDIIAQLGAAAELFVRFAKESDVLSASDVEHLSRRFWAGLLEVGRLQSGFQLGSEPTARFIQLLAAALASGRAHVASIEGDRPDKPEAWGWRYVLRGAGEYTTHDWQPQGTRIGWVDTVQDELYLEPDAAYNVAVNMGAQGGEGLAISRRTLHKRLHERRLLKSTEQARETLTIRRVLQGATRTVLHLDPRLLRVASTYSAEKPDISDSAPINAASNPPGGSTQTDEVDNWAVDC